MTTYQTGAELKNTARINLSGKYGTSILATITPTLSSFIASFPFIIIFEAFFTLKSMIGNTPYDETSLTIITEIITTICALFSGVFRAGLALYFLNIACGKRFSLGDLFFGFRWQFKKSLILSLVFLVISEITSLPYTLLNLGVIEIPGINTYFSLLITDLFATMLQILITLPISQAFYLMLDFPQYSALELLQYSIHLMKGQKGKFLYLTLSFLPMELLCILSCGIGYLWLMPYREMTYAHFFLDIMNPQVSTSEVS